MNGDAQPYIVWCGLNDESNALAAAIPDAVVVEGSMSPTKNRAARGIQDGKHRVLITKPKIAGFGMNFQHCARMVFVGLSDSFEAYYQCIRRCYRFGQTRPVEARIVLSDAEEAIYHNVMQKNWRHKLWPEAYRASAGIRARRDRRRARAPGIHHERCRWRRLAADAWRQRRADGELADNSIGLSVYSPPFASLYTYSNSERDLGNSRTVAEFFQHYQYLIAEILRVTVPGRNTCVHVQQIAAMLERDGYIGIKDFRGDVIRAYEAAGWIYDGEVCIDKDPQSAGNPYEGKGADVCAAPQGQLLEPPGAG